MKIVTCNVNGIRATARRDGIAWFLERQPDVITLQEVRSSEEQLLESIAPLEGYEVAYAPCARAGRNGVAILSKHPFKDVRIGLGLGEFADEGRWIEVDIDSPGGHEATVVSAYVHTGEADTPKQEEKYRFLDAMTERMTALAQRPAAIVTGDFNVAHREVDIKNWKGNLKRAGFLPDERAYLDKWAEHYADLGRVLAGEGPGPYTWWSWRGQAFDNDAGWRIDYVLVNHEIAHHARSVVIGRADSYAARFSDHAPVLVEMPGL